MSAVKNYYATMLIAWLVVTAVVMFLSLAYALSQISLTLQ